MSTKPRVVRLKKTANLLPPHKMGGPRVRMDRTAVAEHLVRLVPGLSIRTARAALGVYADLISEMLIAGRVVVLSQKTFSLSAQARFGWSPFSKREEFSFTIRGRTMKQLKRLARERLLGEPANQPKPPEPNANKTDGATEGVGGVPPMRKA